MEQEQKYNEVMDKLDNKRKQECEAFRNLIYTLSNELSDGELLDLFLDVSDNITFLNVIKILVEN